MINRQRFLWLLLGLILVCLIGINRSFVESLPPEASLIKRTQNLYLPPHKDFRIVVISDLNSQYGSTEYEPEVKNAIALIPQWQPDLVLSGGDMIAGQKTSLSKTQIESMWTTFDRHIAAPLRQYKIPFGFTIGNHDGSGAIKDRNLIFKTERDLARAYWRKYQDRLGLDFVDAKNFPFYYSFQKDGIYFIVWDASTHNISPEQLSWIESALSSPIARKSKLKIAIGHLPLYPIAVAKNKPGEYLAEGEKLRSLLQQNKVKIYISGHHHAYYPGKQEQLELLHVGALGQGSRQLINSDLPAYPTVTIIDIDATSKLTYTTYNAQTWELIPIEQLPRTISTDRNTILRHDL